MLATAEQLFAEHGIAAVALHDIGAAAGQRNNAAVQYHFGDRDTLIREITTYRAAASEDTRAAMLADLLTRTEQPQVLDLVRLFVLPLSRHLQEGNHYLPFLSRYIIERGGYVGLDLHDTAVSATFRTVLHLLRRLLPDYPEALLHERWTIMMTSAVHTLARYQTLTHAGRLPSSLNDLLNDLVRFLTAGIEAPPDAPSEGDSQEGRRATDGRI
jgi:AcrR family transcriptional regulator